MNQYNRQIMQQQRQIAQRQDPRFIPQDVLLDQRKREELIKNKERQQIRYYIENTKNKRIPGVRLASKDIQFANQGRFEEVFIVVRSHWSVNLGWFFRAMSYATFPPFVYWILTFFQFNQALDFFSFTEWNLILLFYYAIVITNTFREYIDWYFDPYFVTNERIVHYDYVPFQRYKIQEAYFDKIENVREVSSGFMANIFGYGDIKINTASEKGEFSFRKVPNPTLIRNIITDLSKINQSYKQRNG